MRAVLKKATLGALAKHLSSSSQVVMRTDFNVPIKDGKVADANRIIRTFVVSQKLYPQSRKSLNITLNLLFSYPMLEDLTDSELISTLLSK